MQTLDFSELPDGAHKQSIGNNPPDKILLTKQGYCSLWWKSQIHSDQYTQLGFIGQFSAANKTAALELLDQAQHYLSRQGCTEVIGPIDGNTWKPYRLCTWSDGSAPFLLEPQNPKHWPDWWQCAGFTNWQSYNSSICPLADSSDPRLDRAKLRLQNNGIHWRTIDADTFEQDLKLIYKLSLCAFSSNVLYSPISEKEFLQQYLPYKAQLDPDYMLIAFNDDEHCCGFIFAMPDYLQLQRGEPLNRLIIKTLAVDPQRQCAGLGMVLVQEVQNRAMKNGLEQVIHALMHDQNNSSNIGKHNHVMRRYTLYKKTL